MSREELRKLIDDNIDAAFDAIDQLDWRNYRGTYLVDPDKPYSPIGLVSMLCS